MRASLLLPLIALALPLAAADEAPQPLCVSLTGPAKDMARKVFLKPYAQATGTELGEAGWDGSLDGLRKLVASHGADLLLLDGPMLVAACRAQLLDRIDWQGLGRDRFLPQAASDCGAGAYLASTVLAWDREKLPFWPGWPDFWDVTKHPGRRGLHRGARGNLEIALMADGVAIGDVYRTLRTPDGLDRAFRKLDQLKPYIVWWDQPGQPAQLLAAGKVLLTSAPSASLPMASLPGAVASGSMAASRPTVSSHAIGVQWAGGLVEAESWAAVHTPAHPHAAQAALIIATDPAREAEFARATGFGPSTTAAVSLLPAASRAQNPSAPNNLQSGLPIDEGFWAENGDRLEARFAAWAGK